MNKYYKVKNIIRSLTQVWCALFFAPLRVSKHCYSETRLLENFMVQVCKQAEKIGNVYVSHTLRPVEAKIENEFPDLHGGKELAVILQGPILHEKDFTLNTVRLYRRFLNKIHIIVSTWDNEDKDYLKKINDEGAIVVCSKLTANKGPGNVNCQIISTQAGIRKAIELNVNYICKTRTDQRVNSPYALFMLKDLLSVYPVSSESHLNHRIVVLNTHFGSMFEPYYISDFFYFGHKDEMIKMLQIPLSRLDQSEYENIGKIPRKEEVVKCVVPEIYLTKQLMKALNENYEDTVYGYWMFLKNSLMLIDKSFIGLYWPKYDTRYCEHIRNCTYSARPLNNSKSMASFDFASWVCLVNGEIEYKKEYEKYLDLPI